MNLLSAKEAEEENKKILFNRQVNYMTIERVWKIKQKDKGISELYELLGLNQNVYSRIRQADEYNYVDLESRWGYKTSRLQVIGLSKEIMIGLKMIEIPDIEKRDWEEYIDTRYGLGSETNRNSNMAYYNRKINNAIKKIEADKMDKSDIGKLVYFCTYLTKSDNKAMPDKEMNDLKSSLECVTIEKIKQCNAELREEVLSMMEDIYNKISIIVKYSKL